MIDVDSLQRDLSIRDVAAYYGVTLPEHFGTSGEQRMPCPCTCCTGHGDERSVSINTSDPFKRWKCHRENYGCGAQGNLVTLAYCFKHGAMPPSGKPTGKEFFAIAEDLQRIGGGEPPPPAPTTAATIAKTATETAAELAATVKNERNKPLAESDNENARKLVDLDQKLVIDLAQLSPAASRYARRRPFLLSEALAKECHFGYMPSSSNSSLRGKWVYGVIDEQGEALAWVGRNPRYDDEQVAWTAAGRHG